MVGMWLVLLDKMIKNYMIWFFFFFFGDGDTSSYKTNVVKFVILVTLINKKSDINSEKKKTKTKTKTRHWWNGLKRV